MRLPTDNPLVSDEKSAELLPQRTYIKTRRNAAHDSEYNALHVHVDSQEIFSEEITRELESVGLVNDSFDEFHYYGKDGDPTKPFPHFAPAQHHTLVTSNIDRFRQAWRDAVRIVEKSGAQCYIEGELIVLDEPLPIRPFDPQAFDELVPLAKPGDAPRFFYKSAIDGRTRLLPVDVDLRRLDPVANGRRDQFRRGEVHVTLREGTNAHMLELLGAIGLSFPAIPKLLEGEDGALERNADGSLRMIRDFPLTLQAVDMRQLMRVANLVVTLIEKIGGVEDGSVKLEFATQFAILNGVDYNRSVPPVLASAQFRSNFEEIGFDRLGTIDVNLAQLTRAARKRVRTTPHHDQTARFQEIWTRTLQESV